MRRVWLGLAIAGIAASAGWAQTMAAQNTYAGGVAAGEATGYDPYLAADALADQQAEIRAAETNLSLGAGFMHTQYHENITPGSGDDENGFSYGGSAGASVLLPNLLVFPNDDLYAALQLDVSAGNLTYGGHEENLLTGAVSPVTLTDRAVFLRFESRFGIGFRETDGVEFIPFLAGGYQSWNRNIDVAGNIGTDEDYDTALLGGGFKLDAAVTPRLVLSGTAEALAMIAGSIDYDSLGENAGLGGSAQYRVDLNADYAVSPHLHVIGALDWEYFNYAGNKFTTNKEIQAGPYVYEISEPVSDTTQYGLNVGVAYSF